MGYLNPDFIEEGDVSNAAEDGAFLDDLAALSLRALNLRPEAFAGAHFDASRDPAAENSVLPVITWIRTHAPVGTSSHSDVAPGTPIAGGATTVELVPPNDIRATLAAGDVLRWHASCLVEEVDYSGSSEQDEYFLEVRISGVDGNGAATKGASDSGEFGIVAGFSMNSAGIASDPTWDGSIRAIEKRRISVSGIYIHQGEFSPGGGNVRITLIRANLYVRNAANAVSISNPRLTAYIAKG